MLFTFEKKKGNRVAGYNRSFAGLLLLGLWVTLYMYLSIPPFGYMYDLMRKQVHKYIRRIYFQGSSNISSINPCWVLTN